MPVFVACVKADLENVERLETLSQVWKIDVKHGSSDEVREGVTIDATEFFDLEGSRGTCNLVIKFKDAVEKAQCTILTDKKLKVEPRPMTAEDSDWVPFLAMEARGLEVTRVHVSDDNFLVTASSGASFTPDLSDGDWADYDDDNQLPVSITNLQTKVDVVR